LWDARIYASHVGNPFARRHNFYRKVATIPRQSCNEKGEADREASNTAVILRCSPFFTASLEG
jgi:hypothetical protein